jgi:cytoskeleton protein RodZ
VSDPPATPSTLAIPELVELGTRLSRGREAKGLSVAALADRLRIGPDQLDALERGDRAGLREPVFVIAQAKRVAGALGIDVNEQIANLRASRFMQESTRPLAMPIPLVPAQPTNSRSAGGVDSAASPHAPSSDLSRKGVPPLMLLLLGGFALAAALVGLARGLRLPGPPPADRQMAEPPSGPPTPPAAAPPTSAAPPMATLPAVPLAEELVLRASEPSWLEVRNAAGTTLFEGTLSGEKRFRLGRGLAVMAGRPYAVTAQMGDRPAAPLGRVDEIVWRRFPPAASPAGPAPSTTTPPTTPTVPTPPAAPAP